MRVLLISNQHPNDKGVGNPIMYRMRNALMRDDRIEKVEFIPFYNKISIFSHIRQTAKKYNNIHVHFGGLYAFMIWISLIGINAQKLITFHGTDIHAKQLKTAKGWKKKLKIHLNQLASFFCIVLYNKCGFVAKEMIRYVPNILTHHLSRKYFIQPLGVDYSSFVLMNKQEAQNYLGLTPGKYILFSDVSNTSIKRRDIAEAIVALLGAPYQLLIMSGVKPLEVPYYINACDFALLTSDEEGSPNIIREVLSLNKPFFSVNVGDAAKQLSGLQNSAIISRNPQEAVETIKLYMEKPYKDNTRDNLCNRLDFIKLNQAVIKEYI